ncbi:hypothetical protein EX30DRAFT_63839 [Ascodesmis nigricans]|uniref:Uncharacterized protein n=1 Tax=Ascodesmis nigricans TaxID=341454 RepID=A0A4S2MUG9_9PEZI|nr:hypothetical protein EX30DRAFT_63839 [Ascodesmis nigricans]
MTASLEPRPRFRRGRQRTSPTHCSFRFPALAVGSVSRRVRYHCILIASATTLPLSPPLSSGPRIKRETPSRFRTHSRHGSTHSHAVRAIFRLPHRLLNASRHVHDHQT